MKRLQGIWNHKMTRLGLAAVPIVIVAAGLAIFSLLPKSSGISIEGTVEISTSPYFAAVSGTVARVLAEPGQWVEAGDVLAEMDSKGIENEIAQLQETLIIKNARLKEIVGDADVGAIDAARRSAKNNVTVCQEKLEAAERALRDAGRDLETQRELFRSGSISQKELRGYETAAEEKASAVAIARAQLEAAQNSVEAIAYPNQSANEIEGAQADVRLTELQIEKLRELREDYTIRALKKGLVVEKNVDPGAAVVAGQSLFALSNETDRYFVFYLPEEYSKAAEFGGSVPLYRLNSDEAAGQAQISYMDWKAIYTPKDFESEANKNKRSIKIKALIESPEDFGVGETVVTKIQGRE